MRPPSSIPAKPSRLPRRHRESRRTVLPPGIRPGSAVHQVEQTLIEKGDEFRRGALLWSVDGGGAVGPGQGVLHVAGDDDLDAGEVGQVGGVDRVDLGAGSPAVDDDGFPVSSRNSAPRAASMPAPPSVLAEPPSASTIRWGPRRSSEMMAWPRPWLVASSGASFPSGRVCRPQVLATSMTAVVPSNAADGGMLVAGRVGDGDPDAAESGCDGGFDAAVAAVGEGQSGADDPAFGESRAEVVDHLGGGEAALELVRCQENLHDLVFSSSTVTLGMGQWERRSRWRPGVGRQRLMGGS